MKSLFDLNFYDYLVLKWIIDGEYWNGKIYGKMYDYYFYGRYIFLKKEKVFIYFEDMEYDYLK